MTDPNSENEAESWSSASLRIVSESYSIEQVSRLMGAPPSQEKVIARDHGRATSVWVLDSGLAPDVPLESKIRRLVEILEDHSEAIALLSQDSDIDLFCGFSSPTGQGGLVLRHQLLRQLAGLQVDVTLDLYP